MYRFQLRAKPRNFKPVKVKVDRLPVRPRYYAKSHQKELLDKTQQVIAQTDHMSYYFFLLLGVRQNGLKKFHGSSVNNLAFLCAPI